MENQYWSSVHARLDQKQVSEEDEKLREFLTAHKVNAGKRVSPIKNEKKDGMTLSELARYSFLCSEEEAVDRSLLFFQMKYNSYAKLEDLQDHYFGLYGIRGTHRFGGRATPYYVHYMSEDSTLLGQNFFDYVFDSYYPYEEEVKVESVKALLDEKKRLNNRGEILQISEKDRMLVCRIAEGLWRSQIEHPDSRFVICMDHRLGGYSRSVELLKQVYLLLPQRLRLKMGFCTCATTMDLVKMVEQWELPVHVFTMIPDEVEKLENAIKDKRVQKPIVFFDPQHIEEESIDKEKLNLLLELSKKITPSSDAKLAYAEKVVTKEKRSSFKSLEEMLKKINSDEFCWWDRKDLDTVEEIRSLCMEQKEIMDVPILKEEALTVFYRKLLPWKDYAEQIARVVEEDTYSNRQEILEFFSSELEFAKVVEAMQNLRSRIEQKAKAHETAAVAAVQTSWDADVAERQKQKQAELEEKDRRYAALKEEKEQQIQGYLSKLKSQEQAFAQEREEQSEKHQKALRKEQEQRKSDLKAAENAFNKELKEKQIAHLQAMQAEKKRSEQEIQKLNDTIEQLSSTDNVRKVNKLQSALDESNKQKKELKQGKKVFLITTILAGSAAVVFLALTIVFGLKSGKNGELTTKIETLESEISVLESEKGTWKAEKEDLSGQVSELESNKEVLESEKGVLESEKTELESEKEVLESEKKELESGNSQPEEGETDAAGETDDQSGATGAEDGTGSSEIPEYGDGSSETPEGGSTGTADGSGTGYSNSTE